MDNKLIQLPGMAGQQQIKIDLNDIDEEKCNNCGGTNFDLRYTLKKISALQMPDNKEKLIKIETFVCVLCKLEWPKKPGQED